MVNVETVGRPSGAVRKAFFKRLSDQVAVPSRAGVGGRRTSRRMRAWAAAVYVGWRPPP